MALFGAHVSSAGSILKTFERAEEIGAEVFQFFLRSPRVWHWKGVSKEIVRNFREKLSEFKNPVMVHAPYLLNLASPKEDLRKRSVEVFLEELIACEELGVDFYNFHPGTATGIGEKEGMKNILRSLEEIFSFHEPRRTTVLLENTAGERGDLGKNFDELSLILKSFDGVRIGVCLDTCHAFAYGYEINTDKGFSEFLKEVDKIGIENIKAIHANDSKFPLGSKKDRHEHIGKGFIGLKGFKNLLTHEYFRALPYFIETPKAGDMDRVNLEKLRSIYSGRI